MKQSDQAPGARTLGAVYTPAPLARFVLDRLTDEGKAAIEGRWLDPACGDGVFLSELVERLAAQVSAKALPALVEERLFGIDVDPGACARARVAVHEAVARRSGPQGAGFFSANVTRGDFLEHDPEARAAFDVVVGNPPYVSAQVLTAAQKRHFLERFQTAWGRLDLYSLFIEQGLRMLGEGGGLAFITPDKWLTASSSGRLRQYVAESYRVRAIERFERHDLFPGVATVPCVAVIERDAPSRRERVSAPCRHWHADPGADPTPAGAGYRLAIGRDGSPWRPRSKRRTPRAAPLGEFVERISVGLATGLNSCFVLDATETHGVEDELLRPAVRGRDVRTGELLDSGLKLLLPYSFEPGAKPSLVDLEDWPGALSWLADHREALERRHCVRVWEKRWYDLHDPVVTDLAGQPKILCPDLAREPRFAFDPGGVVPLHSAYYLVPRERAAVGLRALVTVLNSEAIASELRLRAPTAKSGYRRLQAQVLRDLPIPNLSAAQSARIEEDDDPDLVGDLEERVTDALRRHAA